MKKLLIILKNLKNLIPYFLLIGVYFILINIEAGKDNNNNKITEKKYMISNDNTNNINKDERVKIPVIPYKQ